MRRPFAPCVQRREVCPNTLPDHSWIELCEQSGGLVGRAATQLNELEGTIRKGSIGLRGGPKPISSLVLLSPSYSVCSVVLVRYLLHLLFVNSKLVSVNLKVDVNE